MWCSGFLLEFAQCVQPCWRHTLCAFAEDVSWRLLLCKQTAVWAVCDSLFCVVVVLDHFCRIWYVFMSSEKEEIPTGWICCLKKYPCSQSPCDEFPLLFHVSKCSFHSLHRRPDAGWLATAALSCRILVYSLAHQDVDLPTGAWLADIEKSGVSSYDCFPLKESPEQKDSLSLIDQVLHDSHVIQRNTLHSWPARTIVAFTVSSSHNDNVERWFLRWSRHQCKYLIAPTQKYTTRMYLHLALRYKKEIKCSLYPSEHFSECPWPVCPSSADTTRPSGCIQMVNKAVTWIKCQCYLPRHGFTPHYLTFSSSSLNVEGRGHWLLLYDCQR